MMRVVSALLLMILSPAALAASMFAQQAVASPTCTPTTTAPIRNSPLSTMLPFFTGALTAILGGLVTFGSTFATTLYKDRHGANNLRRWIFQSHFNLFQDVADCAWNYSQDQTFGIFYDRIKSQLDQLKAALEKDTSIGIRDNEYASIAQSLSSAEYVMWAYGCKFQLSHMSGYIEDCLKSMATAQTALGPWPGVRPNSSDRLKELRKEYAPITSSLNDL